MPDTSDTDTEQTDPAAPDNDEADTAQVTDSSEDAEEVAPAYATIEEFLAAVAAETAAAVILIRHLHRDLQPLRRDLYRSYRELFPQWDLRRSFRQ